MNEFTIWFQGSTWAFIDAIVTSLTVLGVGYNLWQNKKQLNPIKILIEKNNIKEELPTFILRKNFTRSEVQGILRSLHDGDTYNIKFTGNPDFLKAIIKIQQGKSDTLVIPILPQDDFNIKKKRNDLHITKIQNKY